MSGISSGACMLEEREEGMRQHFIEPLPTNTCPRPPCRAAMVSRKASDCGSVELQPWLRGSQWQPARAAMADRVLVGVELDQAGMWDCSMAHGACNPATWGCRAKKQTCAELLIS